MGKTANSYHVFSIKRHKNLTYYDNAKSPELYKRHYSNFIVCMSYIASFEMETCG